MELADLARKHKRARDWIVFAEENLGEAAMKTKLLSEVRAYEEFLTNLWRRGAVSEADANRVLDMENRLNSLHEEARLLVGPAGAN